MNGVEILRKVVEDWSGGDVPDRLALIVQAVGLKAAGGGYTASETVEVHEALESLARKTYLPIAASLARADTSG